MTASSWEFFEVESAPPWLSAFVEAVRVRIVQPSDRVLMEALYRRRLKPGSTDDSPLDVWDVRIFPAPYLVHLPEPHDCNSLFVPAFQVDLEQLVALFDDKPSSQRFAAHEGDKQGRPIPAFNVVGRYSCLRYAGRYYGRDVTLELYDVPYDFDHVPLAGELDIKELSGFPGSNGDRLVAMDGILLIPKGIKGLEDEDDEEEEYEEEDEDTDPLFGAGDDEEEYDGGMN